MFFFQSSRKLVSECFELLESRFFGGNIDWGLVCGIFKDDLGRVEEKVVVASLSLLFCFCHVVCT